MTAKTEAIKKSLEALESFKDSLNTCLNSLDFEGLVTWEDLWSIPLASAQPLTGANGESIFAPKLHQDENTISFLTVLLPQESFDLHQHPCLEVCHVLTGVMADKKKPSVLVKTGDSHTYNKYVKHQPFNPSQTEPLKLLVTFKNPNK